MSRPEPYMNGSGHPPGHAYQPYHDARGYSGDGYGPQQPHDKQQPYFEPPPRESHPESVDDRYYSYEEPPPGHEYADRGPPPEHERPYAPDDPSLHELNQVTPYDDEKAEAEWRRGVESAYTYQRPPPPPQDPEYLRRRALEDEARERGIEREREVERQRRYEEDRYYEERDRDRERERERRRRREEDSMREKVLRYPSDPKKGGRDVFGGSEAERGLGSKIAGGAGGALIGHELSDNILGTLGGAVVGAVAANVLEKHHEKRQNAKMAKRASRDGAYPVRSGSLDYPQRTRSYKERERDRYDDRYDSRYDDRYERGRERSASRSAGIKDRIMRSLSRARSKSAPRRRSPSYDSEYSHRR